MSEGWLVTAKTTVLFAFALIASVLAVSPPGPANAQVGGPPPDTISLTGTVRDFQRSHPDFEFAIGTDRGIVEPAIDADRKPVYAYTPPASSPTTTGRENFDQWYRDVPGVNLSTELTLTLDRIQDSPPLYRFDDSSFFPIDGLLWGNEGRPHNYWFTFELHAQFTYQGGEVFTFRGDDDVFLFIDDQLVIDLGGVHGAQTASVSLDSLGLTAGETYPLDLFFAERHTSASSFRIDTTLQLEEVPDPEPEPEPTGVLPPVAAAGPDQTVLEGSTVQLDGSGSSDPNPGLVEQTFQSSNLPGGTSVDVSIDGLALAGATTLLAGTAAVGEGPPVADTAVVYVIDLSGSANFTGGCGGDQNNDGAFNRILDCEIASVLALHDQVLAAGTVSQVGLVTFSSGSATRDLNPTGAQQFLIAPDADADGNGVPDLEQTLRTLRAGGATNFSSPAARACGLLAGSPVGNRVVVFLSDGQANRGTVLSNVLPCDPPATFEAFAIGQGSSCTGGSAGRKLQDMADLTGGSCIDVTDPVDLPDILPEVIGSTLVRVLLGVDGETPIDVTDSVDPLPPLTGPATAAVLAPLPALPDGVHEVCLTVEATDAGGTGSVTTCSLLRVGDAPLLFEWTLIDADGPPIVLSSTTDPAPTFQTADDATYLFELKVTNGFGLSATDRITVTVSNADPLMVVEPGQGVAGGVTLINASFTDQGYLDTHTTTLDWGDGTVQTVPVTAQGSGWGGFFGSHIYASAGAYDVTITVVDDDGGSDTTSLGGFVVADPVAVWANSETARATLDWTGSSGIIEGRVHTNNELRVAGKTKTIFGPSTYAGSLSANTGRHVFDPAPQPAPVQDYPIRFDVADYRPGGGVATAVGDAYHDMSSACAKGKWHETQVVLEPGVYYADCDIQINGSDIGGAITLVAEGSIQVSGSRPAFEPYYDGLLFLAGASGDKAIDLAASSSKFLGVLFAEHGEIDISGSGNRFYCGILGDRVDLAGGDLEVRGASCGRPDSTVAGPLLVPELQLALVGQPGEVLPSETIDYDVSIANTGAILVAPGLIGLENVDVEGAAVRAYAYVLEYFSVADGAWVPFASAASAAAGYTPSVPLPTLGGIDLALQPNPFSGVTFPTGADPVIGTVIDPDGFATWGAQAVVSVDPALVDTLLDPALVDGIRNRVTFELDPAAVQVRRLFTFGSDFIDALRALSGDVTDVELTLTLPTGDPLAFDATNTPALALLAPGATVALEEVYTAEVPAPRGDGETDDAYLNRLLAADGSTLAASAFARATGGVGLLIAPTDVALATERLPVVDVTKTGPGFAVPGETLDYAITANNRGSVDAVTVVVADDFDGTSLALDPAVPATLSAGQVVRATASASVDPDAQPGTLVNRVSATWSDTAGNLYGPVGASVSTEIGLPAALTATLVDSLGTDADGNGLVTPGDTLFYEAVIANTGDLPLADVVFYLLPDTDTTLDTASVVATDGMVDTAGGTITVTVASLAGRSGFSVFFEAEIADPLPEGVASVTQQGTVTATGLDPAVTDDPAAPGLTDPTVTFVVIPQPAIAATLAGALAVDADGDGQVSPGDTVSYQFGLANDGGASATAVDAMVDLPVGTTLGAVLPSQGTDESVAGMLKVDLGVVPSSGTASIAFDLTLDAAFAFPTLSVQGVVTSAELAPVLTDDPNTAAETDPTVLPVAFPGGGGPGGGPSGGNGLPAPTVDGISPEEGLIITEPTAIDATLTPPDGETVTGWSVGYRKADQTAVFELASGTGPAVTAIIDPTVLGNGIYYIVITTESSNGGIGVTESSVVVDGDLKLGRFQISYVDLSVPIVGLPINIVRTYDTVDRGASGDFGFGWSLDIADFQVSTNRALGAGGWTMFGCGGGLIFSPLCFASSTPHFVTVTWPNGYTEIFDLTPAKGLTFFPGLTLAEFTGRPGSTSELEAVDSSLFFTGDGNLYGGLFGSGPVYNPTRFRLTDRFGNEYLLDRNKGLLSLKTADGPTLSFSLAGIVSSDGPTVDFVRDSAGRIAQIVGPDAQTVSYTYDAAGDLVSYTDAASNPGTYVYDTGHYLTDFSGAGGPAQTLTYDNGRLTSITDADGNTTLVDIDVSGRTETWQSPDGRLTQILTRNKLGDIVRSDAVFEGRTLTWISEYDANGKPTLEIDPLGNRTEATWDDQGNLLTSTDPSGIVTVFTYNADSRPTKITYAGETVFAATYDAEGRLASSGRPGVPPTTLTYNGQGRPATVMDPEGRVFTYTYNANGYLSKVQGVGGWDVEYVNDASGRVLQTIDQADRATTYTYDDNGRMTSLTDADGRVQSWTYHPTGQIETYTDKAGKTVTFVYDAAGRPERKTDRNGEQTVYTYTPNGLLETATSPDGTTSFAYDPLGRLVTVTDPDTNVEFTWDDAGALASQRSFGPGLPDVTLLNSATPDGRPLSVSGLGSTTLYAYDAQGRIQQVVDSVAGTFDYTYSSGRPATLARPNGVVDTYTFTAAGQLERRESALGAVVIDSIEYGYSPEGIRSSYTDGFGTSLFDFDELGRVTSVDHPAGSPFADEAYTFDAVGNRTSAPGRPSISYDGADRLTSDGIATYAYDDEGQLVSRTEIATSGVTSFAWDAYGQLESITYPDLTQTTFRYDGLSRRVEVSHRGQIRRFVHDGPNIRHVLDGANQLVSTYVTSAGVDEFLAVHDGSDALYPLRDALGTTTALTDASGAVVEGFVYDSLGNRSETTTSSTPYAWAGLTADPSGLLHARARYYDPGTGAFLSEDPVPSVNRYLYGNGNPLNFVDPTGLTALSEYGAQTNDDTVEACAASRAIVPLYDYLSLVIEIVGIFTPPGGAVFWSGSGNQAAAQAFASKTGRFTLELTPGGSWLEGYGDLRKILGDAQSRSLWSKISQRFASNASGEVYAFVDGANPTGVWNQVELPALKKNRRVTRINYMPGDSC